LPALDAAQKALNSLDKKDIQEVKTFATPPEMVQVRGRWKQRTG
jgi:hypothetical protein